MRKIYRGIEYNKYRLMFILAFIVLILVMCTPEYNDVQFKEIKSDTFKTKDGN